MNDNERENNSSAAADGLPVRPSSSCFTSSSSLRLTRSAESLPVTEEEFVTKP